MDVINLAGELLHPIETRRQIHAYLALRWDETKDETPLERRFWRRHEDRRQLDGSPLTIEIGAEFPIGISCAVSWAVIGLTLLRISRVSSNE
jgi:hypothetical protein